MTWDYLDGLITVTRRADDYHACVTGNTAAWDAGRTAAEAIGGLVIAHPDVVMSAVCRKHAA